MPGMSLSIATPLAFAMGVARYSRYIFRMAGCAYRVGLPCRGLRERDYAPCREHQPREQS